MEVKSPKTPCQHRTEKAILLDIINIGRTNAKIADSAVGVCRSHGRVIRHFPVLYSSSAAFPIVDLRRTA